MKSFFGKLVAAQILVVALVVVLFNLLEPRWAGLVAGFLFVLLSVGTLLLLPSPRRRHISFWTSLGFLLFAALPIMAVRFTHWGLPFRELKIFGIPGPQFHSVSGILYMVMILGAAADWIKKKTP